MLQPVGPLPASVYWRRRGIALALVLLVVLLLWAVWPGGGDGGDRRNASAVTGTASATPGELTATPPPNDPGRAPEPGSGSGSASGSAGGTGSGTGAGSGSAPAATPRRTAAPATTRPPAPPKPCTDRALALRVAPERAAYRVGVQPVVTLTVRNVSSAACTRDLGVAQQEILLYRGTQRLWSSNDCFDEAGVAVRTLRPNETVRSSVTWSGKSSRPGCAGTRTRLGAGTYDLIGRVGTLTSPRAPIVLR